MDSVPFNVVGSTRKRVSLGEKISPFGFCGAGGGVAVLLVHLG